MKKINEPTRSFGGIISCKTEDFTSKEHMRSEQKHLNAYKNGHPYFMNGTKDENGVKIKYKVEEKWS